MLAEVAPPSFRLRCDGRDNFSGRSSPPIEDRGAIQCQRRLASPHPQGRGFRSMSLGPRDPTRRRASPRRGPPEFNDNAGSAHGHGPAGRPQAMPERRTHIAMTAGPGSGRCVRPRGARALGRLRLVEPHRLVLAADAVRQRASVRCQEVDGGACPDPGVHSVLKRTPMRAKVSERRVFASAPAAGFHDSSARPEVGPLSRWLCQAANRRET